MGILDLYRVIEKFAPHCLIDYDFSDLYGYRLAVDISIFLYRYVRTAGPEKWMEIFIIFLCELKKNGIKTICIFDGPNPPIEKKGEQEERRKNTKKIADRLKECIAMRDTVQEKYLSENSEDMDLDTIEKCQHLIRPKRGFPDVTDYTDPQDILNSLITTIERLSKQSLPITEDYGKKAFELVRLMGMTAIKADGEAEALCSYLACHNLVDGVLSEDTDVLVYGTPLFFAFKNFKLHEKRFIGIHLPSLLGELELTLEQFKDLCILLSCDYNKRIKGMGFNTSYALIREYQKIENLPEEYDLKLLKYERCRELFLVPQKIKYKIPPHSEPDYKKLIKFLEENHVSFGVEFIKEIYKPMIDIEMSDEEEV